MATSPKRKWTQAEDLRLIRQVTAFPQNMSRCFIMVSDEIGRTPKACEDRWYGHLARDRRNTCLLAMGGSPSYSWCWMWKMRLKRVLWKVASLLNIG